MTRDEPRSCGDCDLCCTLLRVDELRKLGGAPCRHQRSAPPGCGIHPTRPAVCRAYRCLWLGGALDEPDRPDRLGAVLDVVASGAAVELRVHEASPGVFDRSPRLREIAERYRASMPVRISHSGDVLDEGRVVRVLHPGGEERRYEGDRVLVLRGGTAVSQRRLAWPERAARRAVLSLRRWRLRGYEGQPGERDR